MSSTKRSREKYETESEKCLNIYYAMRPMHIVSKVAGLGPFELLKDSESERFTGLVPSTLASAYSLILLVVVIVLFISDIFRYKNTLHKELRTVLFVPSTLAMVSMYSVVIVSITLSVFRTKTIILNILLLIERVDETIGCEIAPPYKKVRFTSLTVIVITFIYMGVACYVNVLYQGKLEKAGHFCVMFIECIIVLQYLHMVILLEHSFARLNNDILYTFGINEDMFYGYVLDKQNYSWKKTNDIEIKTHNSVSEGSRRAFIASLYRLRDLRSLYMTLCHVGCVISSAFGIQILLVLTESLVSSVGYTFTIIIDNVQGTGSLFEWIGLSLYWIASVVEVLVIALSSHRVVTEANRTPGLIHQLLLYNPLNKGLQQFSHQLMHYKLNLSPAGLLALRNTLIFTFFGSFATYTVILLQFLPEEYHQA